MEQVSNQQTSISQSFNWNDFLSFRKMIALKIVQVLYIIVAALITLSGLMIMFKGQDQYGYDRSFMPGGFIGGLVILLLGNVFWRLWCEFIIVLFRINSTLTSIDDTTRRQLISSLPSKQ